MLVKDHCAAVQIAKSFRVADRWAKNATAGSTDHACARASRAALVESLQHALQELLCRQTPGRPVEHVTVEHAQAFALATAGATPPDPVQTLVRVMTRN